MSTETMGCLASRWLWRLSSWPVARAARRRRNGGGVSADGQRRNAAARRRVAAGRVGLLDVHHAGHRSDERAGVAGLHRGGRAVREGGRALRRRRRFRPTSAGSSNLLKLSLELVTPAGPEARRGSDHVWPPRWKATYGRGKWCAEPARPESCLDIEKITEIMATSRGSGASAAGVGRVAHDLRADAPRLSAVRRAGQHRRTRAGICRHGRDVAAEVRHAGRGIHEGSGPAVGPGAAAVRVAPRLRADEASRAVRRRRAGRRSAAGAPSRQYLGAGLVERARPRVGRVGERRI